MIWSVDVLAVVVSIWIQVGITKTALGLRTGPLFVYVPVGFDELRVIGALLVFLAIVYGVCLGVGIVGGIVAVVIYALVSGGALAFSITDGMKPWLAGGMIAGVAAIVFALLYVQVRFTYLLVPATVAEKRFGLWRSWELGKGNFWRIFTVGVGTLSPMLAFEFIMIFAFYFIVALTVLTRTRRASSSRRGASKPGRNHSLHESAVCGFGDLRRPYCRDLRSLAADLLWPAVFILGLRLSGADGEVRLRRPASA